MRIQEKYGSPHLFVTQTFDRKNAHLKSVIQPDHGDVSDFDKDAWADDTGHAPDLSARLFKLQVVRVEYD